MKFASLWENRPMLIEMDKKIICYNFTMYAGDS